MSILEKRRSGAEWFLPKEPIFNIGEIVSVVEPFCDRKCCFEEIFKAKILEINDDKYKVLSVENSKISELSKWDIKKL